MLARLLCLLGGIGSLVGGIVWTLAAIDVWRSEHEAEIAVIFISGLIVAVVASIRTGIELLLYAATGIRVR